MKDQEYLDGLLQGNDKVLNAIYKNFSQRISNHIYQSGGTPDDAKDVFQDALIVIYQKAQAPNFALSSSFYTYLFSVCKFTWYAKKRKKSRQTVTIPEENTLIDVKSIEQDILNRELDLIYHQNFKKLNTICQQLLKLFFEKKSMIEIAHLLKLKNEHTARTRKYRCQENLKKLIEKDDRYIEIKQNK